jgi:hypothetical protein
MTITDGARAALDAIAADAETAANRHNRGLSARREISETAESRRAVALADAAIARRAAMTAHYNRTYHSDASRALETAAIEAAHRAAILRAEAAYSLALADAETAYAAAARGTLSETAETIEESQS